MKKLVLKFGCLLFAYAFVGCDTKNSSEVLTTNHVSNAVISFPITFHDFGVIKAGQVVNYVFEFKNKGTSLLSIGDVSSSCGCTIADWTKVPVKPNQNGIVKVAFSKNDLGIHKKEIIVKSNAKGEYAVLIIKALVEK